MHVVIVCVDNHDVISMRVYDLDELPDEDATGSNEEVRGVHGSANCLRLLTLGLSSFLYLSPRPTHYSWCKKKCILAK